MTTALVFDRDEVDEVEDWTSRLGRLGRSTILWIDLERPGEEEVHELVEKLELSAESDKRAREQGRRSLFRRLLVTLAIMKAARWI